MQSIYGASATTTCAYHVSAHAQYDRPVGRSMTYIQTELALTSLVQGSLRSPQLNAARVCGVMGVVLRRYGIVRWPRGTLPNSTFTYLTFDFQKCDFRLSICRILTYDFHKCDFGLPLCMNFGFRLSQIRLLTLDFYKSDFRLSTFTNPTFDFHNSNFGISALDFQLRNFHFSKLDFRL